MFYIFIIGNGTWFITGNNANPYSGGSLSGTNPAGACWQNVGSAFQVNCNPLPPPPPASPPPPSETCLVIGSDVNEGEGLPLVDDSEYCNPAQSFTAVDDFIYSVGILAYQGTLQIKIYNGDLPGFSVYSLLYTSPVVPAGAYDDWTLFDLTSPIPTVPGQRYTIYPNGTATWFIVNEDYTSGRYGGPGGECWAQGEGVQGASTGCMEINCN